MDELAHTRVMNFQGGVYKQFLVQGGETYRFEIERRFGYSVILDGVFVDRLAGPQGSWTQDALSCMMEVECKPPEMPPADAMADSVREILAPILIGPENLPTAASMNMADRVLRYRAAKEAGAPDNVLGNLRWSLPLWTAADRTVWNETVTKGYDAYLRANPQLRNRRQDP